MFKSRELTACLARKQCLLRVSEINRCLLKLEGVKVQSVCDRIDTAVTLGQHAARLWPLISPLLRKGETNPDKGSGLLAKAKRGFTLLQFFIRLVDT
jgi:hypothetical protein